MEFPYGKASLAILLLALTSGLVLGISRLNEAKQDRPDLVFAIFSKEHAEAYLPVIRQFEKERGVTIQLQVVDQKALQSRLQSAIQAGAETPDMVEMISGSLGYFTSGPADDVGFIDLNEQVRKTGLGDRLIQSRFAMWSDRGHQFALPHDVHPTMLAYRADLVEKLGIDVSELTTWDKFAEVGRRITKDTNGDGVPDRYMIDLMIDGGDMLRMLIAQRGGEIFDKQGRVAFDDGDAATDVIEWYVKQTTGPTRTAFSAGWGQTLAKTLSDGLVLFYVCPDWRTFQFQVDVPSVGGRMKLMPLPAWEPGGLRTSTWGGTGMAFTKQVRERGKFDLAWDLAMRLYYDPKELGPRFAATNILPPLKEAFDLPELKRPRPFYENQPIGEMYAKLAPQVPPTPSSPWETLASSKILEAYTLSAQYYEAHGDVRLRDTIRDELKRAADEVRERMDHNYLYFEDQPGHKGQVAMAADGGKR